MVSNRCVSNFIRPIWYFLALVCIANCGCGESSETAIPNAVDSQSPPTKVSTNDTPVAPSPEAQNIETTSDSGAEKVAQPAVAPSKNVDTPAKVETAESFPKSMAPAAEPTPAQLARWAIVEFEPLQLLDCQESSANGFVACMAHTFDGKHFILAGTSVSLWSVGTAQPEHVFVEQKGERAFKSLAVSPDGKWFAAGDSEGTLHVWNIADRTELKSTKVYPGDMIQIAISPDAKEIATISYESEITILSASELQEINRFKVDTNFLKRIEYMVPGVLVAAGETTSSWNTQTGKLERELSPGRYNYTLARTSDGGRFLFGEEHELKLWSVENAKVESALKGGFATEELIAFSGDGKHLATANDSGIRLWDIGSGKLVQVIDASGWPVTGLSWLPETNLLVVASALGRTRIWGTAKNGEAQGLQPMHTAVAMLDSKSKEPANPAQLLTTMDLRTFPRFPDSTAQASDTFNLSYEAAATPDELQLFYRYQLGKAGWKESAPSVATPGSIPFQKDGFRITASFYEAGPSTTSVSVNFAGNYDLRDVPKFDAAPAETVFENQETVMYQTKADVKVIETSLLRKLHEAGWTAYSRLHASQNEQPDRRDLMFLRNGITLNVSIAPFPADPTNNSVQYSKSLTVNSLPIPQDSGFVEFEGSTEAFLVATTAMNLEQTREFYDKELTAQGWLVREFGRSLKDDHNWLAYIRGQQDLTIGLQSLPTGRTLVRVGDDLEKSSWQLSKEEKPVAEDTAVVGIEAADFPILNKSNSAKYDAIEKSIEFSMDKMPLPEAAELYTKELLSLDWQKDGDGIRSDDYVLQTFVKDKAEISLRGRIADGSSVVNIQGDGLLWSKPLPGGKTVISYATWLRVNHHPATLELLDQYQTEMNAIAVPDPRK